MLRKTTGRLFEDIKLSYVIATIFASALLAFGLYNVHSVSEITEGGALGLVLLLDYWFNISPSVTTFIINITCYALGWKMFGKKFLIYSMAGTGGFSLFYKIFEQFDPVFPQIANYPLLASVVGAMFVGISVGICVRIGGAPTADDAIAMIFSKISKANIEKIYLISDITVLLLSLSYIPFTRIMYSLVTVIISGQIIGLIVRFKLPQRENTEINLIPDRE